MIVTNKVFQCGTFYQKTRTSSMAATDDKPYRETFLINDRTNNQQGGLSYPKRIKTVDCKGCTCKFQFIVNWDMVFGFFVELKKKAGHAIHSSHPKLHDFTYLPLSTCLLTSVVGRLDMYRTKSRYVPYKGTFVPYDGTFGTPDQGQTQYV